MRRGHHLGEVLILGTFSPGAVKSIKPAILGLRGHTLLKVSSASGCLHIQSPRGPFACQLFAVIFARLVTRIKRQVRQVGVSFTCPPPCRWRRRGRCCQLHAGRSQYRRPGVLSSVHLIWVSNSITASATHWAKLHGTAFPICR